MRLFLFLLGLMPALTLPGQQINVDSLFGVTQDTSTAVEYLMDAHNRLARHFLRNDTVRAAYHLAELERLALTQKDTIALVLLYDLQVRKLANASRFAEAEQIIRESLLLSKAIGRRDFESGSYNALGVIKSMQNQYDSVLHFFETSYQIKKEDPDVTPLSLVKSLNNMAATAIRFTEFDRALTYYLDARVLAEEAEDPESMSFADMGLGNVYSKLEDYEKSRLHFRRALAYGIEMSNHDRIGDALQNIGHSYKQELPDSAIHYLNRALQSYELIGRKERIGLSTMALGDTYNNMSRPVEALAYFERAHQNYRATGNRKRVIDVESRLAKTHHELGNNRRARSYMDDVIAYYDSQEDLESSSKAYGLLGKIAEANGELATALSAQKRHQVLKDSLDDRMYNKEVAEITTRYETEVKEAEIENQKAIIGQQEIEQKSLRMRALLIGALFLLGLFGVIQWSIKDRKISKQEALIQSQKIKELEKEKKILSMNAMIEGQEAERTRIAKDLHDGLGGLLATVKAHFGNIQSEITQLQSLQVYQKAQNMMDEACDEVRRISHNLMPGGLRLEGLKSAVEQLAKEMSDAHPFTVMVESIHFDTRMEESKAVFVYRIIQEALNNIIKHADAKNVLIQMSETAEQFHFIIEDDGRGFDPLQIESGLGLKSIRSRVDFLQGTLDIDTRAGVGSTISFHLPKQSL